MFTSARRVFQMFSVSAEVMKANRGLTLLVYPVVGGSVAVTGATPVYYSSVLKGNNDFTVKEAPAQEKEEEDEEAARFKAWELKMMTVIYNKVYKVRRDEPDLFTTAYNGKSFYEILQEDGDYEPYIFGAE